MGGKKKKRRRKKKNPHLDKVVRRRRPVLDTGQQLLGVAEAIADCDAKVQGVVHAGERDGGRVQRGRECGRARRGMRGRRGGGRSLGAAAAAAAASEQRGSFWQFQVDRGFLHAFEAL